MSLEQSRSLYVMHDFEAHQPGERFLHWPQHVTLTPLFVRKEGISRAKVINHITEIVGSVSPFYIEAGELASYGEENDIPVYKIIDRSGRLCELHTSLIENLGSLGCVFDSLDYSLDKYSPHVKDKEVNILTDQPHLVTSVTIGDKLPKIFHMPKRIIKRIEL